MYDQDPTGDQKGVSGLSGIHNTADSTVLTWRKMVPERNKKEEELCCFILSLSNQAKGC